MNIGVEVLKESVIRVQSQLNDWMDCVFVVSKDDEEKAREVLEKAWDSFWEDGDGWCYGNYLEDNYEIESCLTAEVYRSSLGDCTNNGISSYARELYILDAQKGPFEPDDIRQCVYIEKREIMGQEYVDCKPAYCRKRRYMAGGNILYTSDSRFKQITGISYPIAIHDRYEGR